MRSRTSALRRSALRAQVGGQALAVLGARVEAAQRAQAQAQAAHVELAQQRVQQRDRLGVDGGVVGADGLGPELPELAEAPGLRLLLAVVAAQVPELHRLGERVHAVLEVGAADRRGALGAQRQRAPAGVLEGVHLLLDDVGRLAHAAGEELGGLEGRRLDAPVAGRLEDPRARRPRGPPARRPDRAARRTCRAAPGASRLTGPRAPAGRGSSRARAPSVVSPMCPGGPSCRRRSARAAPAIEAMSVAWSAPGQVGAPDRVLEEHVAGEQRPVDRVGDVAGAVAGRGDDVDVEARELQALAAVERLLGLPRLDASPTSGGKKRSGCARIVSSARGQ